MKVEKWSEIWSEIWFISFSKLWYIYTNIKQSWVFFDGASRQPGALGRSPRTLGGSGVGGRWSLAKKKSEKSQGLCLETTSKFTSMGTHFEPLQRKTEIFEFFRESANCNEIKPLHWKVEVARSAAFHRMSWLSRAKTGYFASEL